MEKQIDAKGLSCPAPVLMTKEVLESYRPENIRVFVDNRAALENVSRFLKSRNYEVRMEEVAAEDFCVIGKSEGEESVETETETVSEETAERRIVVAITSNTMGQGDDELGTKLMINFLKTLTEMGKDLWRVVFINSGVKLTVDGAEALGEIQKLESDGIHVLVCGTCLDHFRLLEKKRVGETTNMLDIVTALQLADKVINF
jgi:selenium metabolism protein YedF